MKSKRAENWTNWNEKVDRNRRIVRMYFQEDLTLEEIAQRLVITGEAKTFSKQAVWVIVKRDARRYNWGLGEEA